MITRPWGSQAAGVVPPDPMPARQGLRPLKRWRYVGVFGPDAMFCAGTVRVGPVPQVFWALWDRRSGALDTETRLGTSRRISLSEQSVAVRAGPLRLELALSPVGEAVEAVVPRGGSYMWTRKVPIRADGHLSAGIEVRPVSALGLLDESAGYHARDAAWEWSAGVGTSVDSWTVAWNLVRAVHDSKTVGERTVWVNGRPLGAPAVRFAADLSEVWGADGTVLRFDEEARRSRRESLGLVSSDHAQPFGRFSGVLPGGVELSAHEPAFGVMERHRTKRRGPGRSSPA